MKKNTRNIDLKDKLRAIQDLADDEDVLFHIGMRKGGKVDFLAMEAVKKEAAEPETEIGTKKKRADEVGYIG